ncbi:alpha/beta fold hydrolase [Aliiglaciecola aliphaticivorans]
MKENFWKIIFVTCLVLSLPSYADIAEGADGEIKYNKELDGFEYPFAVNTFELNSQNQPLKMRYMDVGKKSADKTIVLLHGKNFAGYYWERVAKDLVKQNYRVIIPDQIGFGKSSKPDAYQFSFAQLALNTKKLMDHLTIDKFDVVGHSMGGMLAVTFVTNYSDSVDKLILVNPIGLENYSEYVEFKDTNFFYETQLKSTLAGAIRYQKNNYYDGKWSQQYEKLLLPLKGMLAGDDWASVAWNNALTYGPIFSENIVAKFPQIDNKTILIIGTRDKTGPGRGWLKPGVTRTLGDYAALGKNAHKLIKDSVLFELEGLGHMPHYEDYSAFIAAFQKALAL